MSKGAFVDFKKLKDQVGIRRVLERYGLLQSLKEQGERLSGRCPLCEGESESFRVSYEKNCYKCFRCDAGGNVLDFVAAKEECSIREAAVRIAEWFEIQTGKPKSPRPSKEKPREKKEAQPNSKQPAPETEPPEVREPPPLRAEGHSGSPKVNAPLTFELKLDTDHPWFEEAGLLPETMAEFGLGFCSKGVMGGRIAFPIRNKTSELIGYAGLWPGPDLPEGQPLWKYPKDFCFERTVYPAERIAGIESKYLLLTQDPLRVVECWQSGIRSAFCFPGYSWPEDRVHALEGPT